MGIAINNNSGVVNTGDNAKISNVSNTISPDTKVDWEAIEKELNHLITSTNLKSIHMVADEAAVTVKEKNFSKLLSVLKKLGEVGLNIVENTALVILPQLIKKALWQE